MAEVAAGKAIGTHEGLTDFDRSLLWVLTSYLNFGSYIKVKQSDLAIDMNSSPEQISRSLKRIIAAEIISRSGPQKYKLHPIVGTMGARKKRVKEAMDKGWSTIEGEREDS